MHLLLHLFACQSEWSGPPERALTLPPIDHATLSVQSSGVRIASRAQGSVGETDPSWAVDLQLDTVGAQEVGEPTRRVDGATTWFDYDGLSVGYREVPRGVEQELRLEAPRPEALSQLTFRADTALVVQRTDQGFVFGHDGHTRLTWNVLEATDARGTPISLTSSARCDGGRCSIEIGFPNDSVGPLTIRSLATSDRHQLRSAVADDAFGASVSIHDGLVAIGAPRDPSHGAERGRVYVYRHSLAGWEPPVLLETPEGAADRCGSAVAVGIERIAVGCPGRGAAGTVRIHRYDEGLDTWLLETELQPDATSGPREFGAAVAIEPGSGRLAAGAPGVQNEGAVYVYERTGTSWTETAVLEEPGAAALGSSVAIDGDVLVVGTPDTTLYPFSGAAYVYERAEGRWQRTATLQEENPASSLGTSVAVHGDRIVVADAALGGLHPLQRTADGWQAAEVVRTEPASGIGIVLQGSELTTIANHEGELTARVLHASGVSFRQREHHDLGVRSAADGLPRIDRSGSWVVASSEPGVVELFGTSTCAGAFDQPGCDVDLTITELHPNPFHGEEAQGQFVELVQRGSSVVQLDGATLETLAGANPIGPLLLNPGEHHLLVRDADPARNGGLPAGPRSTEHPMLQLGTTSDVVTVRAIDEAVLAEALYDAWQVEGASLQLSNQNGYPSPVPSFPSGVPGAWCDTFVAWGPEHDFSSPGVPNHTCGQDLLVDYTYVLGQGPDAGGTTTFTLRDGAFWEGPNTGPYTLEATDEGVILTMRFEPIGTTYVSAPRPFDADCFTGGFMTELPEDGSGTWAATCL